MHPGQTINYTGYTKKHRSEIGWLTKFLWRSCGADEQILEHCPYSDHVKYACLGGIVLATGIMAGISAAFAFFIAFGPKSEHGEAIWSPEWIAATLIFGTLWGIMIFNLDRYIVSSTGKGDEKETISKQEFINALPRIIMGIIIAVSISKPLEITIFKPEVDAALAKHFQDELTQYKMAADSNIQMNLKELKAERLRHENELTKLEGVYRDYLSQANYELTRGDRPGSGPRHQILLKQAEEAKAEWEARKTELMPKIQDIDEKIKKLENSSQVDEKQAIEKIRKSHGLLLRMKLAHEAAGLVITFFLMGIFMAIELTPIFFKLMMVKGPYDFLQDHLKELVNASHGIERSNIYKAMENGKQVEVEQFTYNMAVKELELKKKMMDVQKELSEAILDKWKEDKKEDISKDYKKYIEEK